jgi:hypothetical protein
MFKKELYLSNIESGGVVLAESLNEAKSILKKEDIKYLVIAVLVEDVELCSEKLKELRKIYSGAIIIKVLEETIGINLLKKGLIDEYYLANQDKEKEILNLKKAYKIAGIQRTVKEKISCIRGELEACLNKVR